MCVFSAVSTSEVANIYMGFVFITFGGIVLYRIHRRRGMVSFDFGKKNDGESLSAAAAREDDVEAASLLTSESLTHKGGIGSEVFHLPLRYKDSYLLPPTINNFVNEYIRSAEYLMSAGMVLSGLLIFTLEKHMFAKFDDHYKVPIYAIIGSSLSFIITNGLFDIVEST